MEQLRGNQVLSGTWAELWMNGNKVMELKKVEIKVSANREDVQVGISMDSKATSLKGEITIGVKKVYTRFYEILEQYKSGKDVRSQVIAKLGDPDAVNGQQERYSVDNVWWNDLPIFAAEQGAIIEDEITGGFTPSDLVCLDRIKYE